MIKKYKKIKMSILERMGMCLKQKKNTKEAPKPSMDEKPPNVIEFVEKNFEKNDSSSSVKHLILKYELSSGTESDFLVMDSEDNFNIDIKNLSNIEKVIMKSIVIFRKNNESFIVEEIKYIFKSQTEKNLYEAIERSVHKKLHRKSNSNNKKCEICGKFQNEILHPSEIDNSNLGKLVYKLKNENNSLKFLAIKAIIITMVNLMNEIIQSIIDNSSCVNETIFNIFYEQFLFMSNICPYIEKDFSNTFRDFRETYQMTFSLCDLFAEIFWDCTFKYKQISKIFLKNYKKEGLDSNTALTLQKIVKALWIINVPLKFQISELLEISSFLGNKKNDLASCIVKEKEINSSCFEDPHIIEESSKKLSKLESTFKSLEYKDLKDSNFSFRMIENFTSEDIFANFSCSNIETINLNKEIYKIPQKNFANNEEDENAKDNETTTSNNSNINDLQSIDEFYNSIFNASEEENNRPPSPSKSANNNSSNISKKAGKKGNNNNNGKKKKRKKNKPNGNKDKLNPIDPIVEEFKNEIGWDSCLHAREIQKIIPIISSEWLKSLA